MTGSTLQGKVAIVTGAGGGIGRATALRLAGAGADIAAVDIDGQTAGETARRVESLGRRALALEVDVTDADAVRRSVDDTAAALGAPAIAVCNAGIIGEPSPFHEENVAHLRRQFAVHVEGAFHYMQATIGPMLTEGWGRLVCTSSIAATAGYPRGSSYAAAKAALLGLVRSIALEYASKGITANCVAPGVIDTDMIQVFGADRLERMRAAIPAKHFGQPEDIAAAIAYLCSPEAGYVTGQIISPNGGLWFS